MPKPKPKPVVPPPPPPEPSFIDDLLDNPLLLGAGGGLLALLGAYVVIRRRRAAEQEMLADVTSTLSQPSSGSAPNSIFRSTGGQSVDTSHASAQTDFSQAGPGSIDTDEVDPVAEADVYMAYGRDAQAEEILLEAKSKEPRRFAIHLKLLEIYSNRKDSKAFEGVASELYRETGGAGADWEKAVVLGLKLDPSNPLYGGVAGAPVAAFNPDATVIVKPQTTRSTVTMPGELSQIATEADKVGKEATLLDAPSLDFDLGVSEKPVLAPEPVPAPLKPAVQTAAAKPAVLTMEDTHRLPPDAPVKTVTLDFNLVTPDKQEGDELGATVITSAGPKAMPPQENHQEAPVAKAPVETVVNAPLAKEEPADIDFDLSFDVPSAQASAETKDVDVIEFDVSLTESTILGNIGQQPLEDDEEIEQLAPMIDLSAIDLNLDSSSKTVAFAAPTKANLSLEMDAAQTLIAGDAATHARQIATVVNTQLGMDDDQALSDFSMDSNEEVTTKLDLAKAYEDMGDLEGARELLQEVIKDGSPAQREKAQATLAKLGS